MQEKKRKNLMTEPWCIKNPMGKRCCGSVRMRMTYTRSLNMSWEKMSYRVCESENRILLKVCGWVREWLDLVGVRNCEGKCREECVSGKSACVTSIELLTYLASVGIVRSTTGERKAILVPLYDSDIRNCTISTQTIHVSEWLYYLHCVNWCRVNMYEYIW